MQTASNGIWSQGFNRRELGSPIILDLNGNGVTTARQDTNGVYFDINNNGFAVHTGWAAGGDGFLVWDRNSDGVIDNGGEMFGNNTLEADNSTIAANGFDALATFDSNSDGKIDSSDAIWSDLQIWVDSNNNGITDPGELHSLSSLGIQSLNLSYYTNASNYTDADPQGNYPVDVGSWTDTSNVTHAMDDVFFATDNANSIPETWVDPGSTISALPDLPGEGTVYNLQQAMAMDTSGDLESLVETFLTETDVSDRNTTFQEILYKWTGADSIDPDSRGSYIDAQKLGVLEAFMGKQFVESTPFTLPSSDPAAYAGRLTQGYNFLFERYYAMMAAQTFLKPYYDEITTVTDSSGTHYDMSAALSDVFTQSESTILEFYRTVFASGLMSDQIDYNGMLSAAESAVPSYMDDINAVVAPYYVPYTGDTALFGDTDGGTLVGSLGNDYIMTLYNADYTIYGNAGDDLIYAGGNNVTVYGGDGNDTIYAEASYNNVVYGGAGDDMIEAVSGENQIYGEAGDDLVMVQASGPSSIFDGGTGTNTLEVLGADISTAVISNFQNLEISGSVTLTASELSGFNNVSNAYITPATIYASTAGTYSLAGLTLASSDADYQLSSYNTTDDITLIGNDDVSTTLIAAGSGADTLYAGANGDTLENSYQGGIYKMYGGDGNDRFVIGYYLNSGDILDGGAGTDVLNVRGADISQASISNIETLEIYGSATLTAAQFSGFDNLVSDTTNDRIYAATAGTYSLEAFSSSTGGIIKLAADSVSGNVTLIGDDTDGQTLEAKSDSGNNVLTAGNGDGDVLDVSSSSGNNTLTAGDGANDILYGGTGSDTFNGGAGYDSYALGYNFQADTINNSSGKGEVDFTWASSSRLWFRQVGNDLVIDVLGTSSELTIANWYSDPANQLTGIRGADNLMLSGSQLNALVAAMATYASANPSFDPTTASSMPSDTTLDSVISAAWSDARTVSVATAESIQYVLDSLTEGYTVVDTAANITAALSFLASDISHINSIVLADGATPTLELTPSQYTSNASVLNKISSPYNVAITKNGVTFDFAQGVLTSLSDNGSTLDFTVNSAASGYAEDISWAYGGNNKVILTLTNTTTSASFSSSLGYPDSGDSLQISGSGVAVSNSSNQELNSTHVYADGSQDDTSYNTSGSGSWASETYGYDAAGNQTKLEWVNTDGSTYTSYYDTSAVLQANVSVNADTSGYIATNNDQEVDFAAGDVLSGLSVNTSGDVDVTVTPTGASAEILSLTSGGITATVGGNELSDTVSGTNLSIDGSGNITATAPLGGFGSSSIVLGVNGTDTFAVGSDTISLAASSLASMSYNNGAGAFTFGLNSVASGHGESVSWNPTTGKATLSIDSFASSLGYINPGDTLYVTGSEMILKNSSAQALDAIEVHSDGSQDDINYNTSGSGSWTDSIYSYDAAGDLTAIRWDNNDGSFVTDFYDPSETETGYILYNADNILHVETADASAINTSGMTTLDVIGSASVTASQLNNFSNLTNTTGSAVTLYAAGAGSYSLGTQSISGAFNLSAEQTSSNVTLTGDNQNGEVLTGGTGNDTLVAGSGNTTLNGGSGVTAYQFGSSFGADTINNDGGSSASGTIAFTAANDEDLWFKQSGNNLVVDLLGTSSSITIENWYSGSGNQVSSFTADGKTLDSAISSLVSAMASYASAHSSFDPTTATSMPTDTTLQSAIASSWHS